MKRRALHTAVAALFSLGALASLPATARVAMPAPSYAVGGLMAVSIVDRNSGRELQLYRHRGEYWVVGTPGARYAVRIRNNDRNRSMAVMSIDGVNVVTGETASLDQNGYVLDGRERSDITGWRKSDSRVAAFEFTALSNSYASRTGRPDNVGVIGVASFRERPIPEPQYAPPVGRQRDGNRDGKSAEAPALDEAAPQAEKSASARRAPAAPAPSLGTGHGRSETSHVGHTTFERLGPQPDEVIRIRYDSRDNLVAAGIIPQPAPRRYRPEPSAFPGSEAGYVPDPPRSR